MTKNVLTSRIESDVIPDFLAGQIDTRLVTARELVKPTSQPEEIWKSFEIANDTESDHAVWFSMTSDLLRSFDELIHFFNYTLQRKSWLNTFLLAAGLNQITEDYLHSDPLQFEKAASILGKLRSPLGPFLAGTAHLLHRIWRSLQGLRSTVRTTIVWQRRLVQFTAKLAELVTDAEPGNHSKIDDILMNGQAILDAVEHLPALLKNELNRLPSCFRSFDQRPDDLKEIIRQFSARWPDRQKLITVIGIRTSGSFLAPLYYAFLKSLGYQRVEQLTIRPERSFDRPEKAVIRKIIKNDGLVLLCDDPPISGSTVMKAAAHLEKGGIPKQNIILMLQLFGDSSSLPASLQRYPAVLMNWSDWNIHVHLDQESVKQVLSNVCSPSFQIIGLERILEFEDAGKREHISALFQVKVKDEQTNLIFARLIRIKGTGLGYFGEHVAAISEMLPDYAPRILALQNGLVYQEIMPAGSPANDHSASWDEKSINQLVNYVIERNKQLPVKQDDSLRLIGRNAVWEVASNILSQTFGRAWFLARMPLIDPYIKKALKPNKPSIIDGDMTLRRWFKQVNNENPLIKLNLAERDFSHQDLFSYDPVYDLACLEQNLDPDNSFTLKASYELLTGEKISPERWMLYQLVHLWDISRQGLEADIRVCRKMSRVVQSYFSEIFFKDLKDNPRGPLCVFDIDGVLETRQLGYSSLSPTSARCLRALSLHGYRILLATGRSLGELKERCASYHLAGGVAEYGGVIYDHTSGRVVELMDNEERHVLEQLRSRLSGFPGIFIDPDYEFSVRAYRLDKDGQQIGLSDDDIDSILAETGINSMLQAVPGSSQTDFLPKRVNKGLGLSEWIARFSADILHMDGEKLIQLAVGDSASDLSMLDMAKAAFAPANASLEVREAGIKVLSRPYQLGLMQATTILLGHKLEGCSLCERKTPQTESKYMENILSAQENGIASMVWNSVKLFANNKGH